MKFMYHLKSSNIMSLDINIYGLLIFELLFTVTS